MVWTSFFQCITLKTSSDIIVSIFRFMCQQILVAAMNLQVRMCELPWNSHSCRWSSSTLLLSSQRFQGHLLFALDYRHKLSRNFLSKMKAAQRLPVGSQPTAIIAAARLWWMNWALSQNRIYNSIIFSACFVDLRLTRLINLWKRYM